MSSESAEAPVRRPGTRDLNTGPTRPDPFVAGLKSGPDGHDEQDPVVGGLASGESGTEQ
mgnify:CR=1 FL=1